MILPNLPIDEYHARGEVGSSQVRTILKAPAKFRAWTEPGHPPEPERDGQLEGALAHCALLEPLEFDRRYVIVPEDAPTKPTKAMREAKKPAPATVEAIAWWTEFGRASAGKTFISAKQRNVALAQAESLRRIPEIRQALAHGYCEVSAFWIDPETGIACRCRPDLVFQYDNQAVILFDLKTYSDASPDGFTRQVERKGYHVQDAFYSDGYAVATDVEVLGFIFAAVEMEYPYLAAIHSLDEASREQGRRDYKRALRTLAECRRTDTWPGYPEGVNLIRLSQWRLDQDLKEQFE